MSANSRNSDGMSTSRRRAPRIVNLFGPLALFAAMATGCRGNAAPAVQSNEALQAAEAATTGAIGPAQEGDGVSVTIDAIRTTDGSVLVDIDPSTTEVDTEPLELGQEFLVLDVTITNTGSAPHEFNALTWSAEDLDSGQTFQPALLGMTGRDLAAGDLEPDESTGGDVVIPIPADATKLRITYGTQLFNQGTDLTWEVTVP